MALIAFFISAKKMINKVFAYRILVAYFDPEKVNCKKKLGKYCSLKAV